MSARGAPGAALEAIEEALWAAAQAALPAAVLGQAALARAITLRSRRYTSERDLLDEPMESPAAEAADLAARALFFAVADAAKVGVPLAELDRRGLLPPGPPRLLDLGAGAGAMTLGTAAYLADTGRAPRLRVTAVDRDRGALGLFERAAVRLAESPSGVKRGERPAEDEMAERPPRERPAEDPMADRPGKPRWGSGELRWGASEPRWGAGEPGWAIELEVRGELLRRAALEPGRFDLVLAGGVLNELDPPGRLDLVERAVAALAPGGALILVEPALRETSRDLHRVRDHVLAAGLASVFAPCTRAAAPCPALARERDWCHEDRPIALPPRAGRLAQVTGLRDGGMKFAYLVLRRAADPLVEAPPGRAALRVVSDPRKQKGRRECIACGDAGWVSLRLLSRHRSGANRPFERARRGDVLLVDDAAPAGEIRDLRRDEDVDCVDLRPRGG
jgi:hypothetical protein